MLRRPSFFDAIHASTRFEKNHKQNDEDHDGTAGLTTTASEISSASTTTAH